PIGANGIGTEVIGRPFTNEYTGFAGPDRVTNAPPFPYYTNTAGRAGQWKYYYASTSDFRPPQRTGFPSNGTLATYPTDRPGSDQFAAGRQCRSGSNLRSRSFHGSGDHAKQQRLYPGHRVLV